MDAVPLPGLRPEFEGIDLVVEYCMPITRHPTPTDGPLGTVRLAGADGSPRPTQTIVLDKVDQSAWDFLQQAYADRVRFRGTRSTP